jgi:glycosyltransferase involved in cell wall biosynthesis
MLVSVLSGLGQPSTWCVMKILHITTSLSLGGAEVMLYKLLSRLDPARFDNAVVSLTPPGQLAPKISELGVSVDSVHLSRSKPSPFALARLHRIIRRARPDIIQGWMYHGNIAASLGNQGDRPLIMTVRHALVDIRHEKLTTRWMIQFGARVSRRAAATIYNSEAGAQQHQAQGYAKDRAVVIPNGFDTEIFKPDGDARDRLRRDLGVASDTVLVGLVARYHPVKDHANFIRAAAQVSQGNVLFVLAGTGADEKNSALMAEIRDADVTERFHLLGERDDVPAVQAALDIATSASHTDSFPNVIGEAMACGVPCVVTDVGDCGDVVGDTGLVVPPRNPQALANAWMALLSKPVDERRLMGIQARKRIIERYSLPVVVKQFERVYEDVWARPQK